MEEVTGVSPARGLSHSLFYIYVKDLFGGGGAFGLYFGLVKVNEVKVAKSIIPW